ncbi:GroES-like protein [Poronia punctata]|nr:GroES-like protein [Poronia punctata]
MQTAIVARGPGAVAIDNAASMPHLRPDSILVKTIAVAINPIDVKLLDVYNDDDSATGSSIQGHDFAGTVVALGADVRDMDIEVGDRVAGPVPSGAFAQYVVARADLVLKLPGHVSFEKGAGLGIGVATAALAVFDEEEGLGIPLSRLERDCGAEGEREDEEKFVLVVGGSTASGTRAMQLLRSAGYRPLTTTSAPNMPLALRFGAEKVFDYHDPATASAIRSYTSDELSLALDCVTTAETTRLCYDAMGRAGGRYVALEPFQKAVALTRPLTIEPSWIMGLTIFGEEVRLHGEYGREARPQHRILGARVFRKVQGLLERGRLLPHPVEIVEGGWHGVLKGLEMMRMGTPSGYKLVASVA